MKNQYIQFSFIAIILMMSNACIKDVEDIKSPTQLVISGILCPQDTMIRIGVRKTIPYFNQDNDFLNESLVRDAEVIMSDGEKTVRLHYVESNPLEQNYYSYYTIASNKFPLTPGKTYYLNVHTPDGLSAEASCQIPADVSDFTFLYDSTSVSTSNDGETNYYYYYYSMTWKRSHPEDHYMAFKVSDDLLYSENQDTSKFKSFSRIFYSRYDSSINDNLKLSFHNAVFTGKNARSSIAQKIILCRLDKSILELMDHSYSFSSDPLNTEDTIYTDISFEGVNVGEPVYHYTNINGALGLFGAYQRITIPIEY